MISANNRPTISSLVFHQHLWYNQLMDSRGIKTKLLWQNPEYREHMKQAHLGQKAWNKDLKTGLVPKTAYKKDDVRLMGENHHAWKGDNVGYFSLHNWIKRQLGKPTECVNGHIAKRYYWANISGEYKRDLSDWHELCWYCNHNDGVRIPERFKI